MRLNGNRVRATFFTLGPANNGNTAPKQTARPNLSLLYSAVPNEPNLMGELTTALLSRGRPGLTSCDMLLNLLNLKFGG